MRVCEKLAHLLLSLATVFAPRAWHRDRKKELRVQNVMGATDR